MLEFVTLVALRIREPQLKRDFRVPGGLIGAILAGVFPLALLLHRDVRKREPIGAGDERACFWRADHGGGIWRVRRDAKTAQAHDRRTLERNSSRRPKRYFLLCAVGLIVTAHFSKNEKLPIQIQKSLL